ncbi:MAG: twin-arginine translocase TatA/TatE family subunit [Pseudomonadota bacterium]
MFSFSHLILVLLIIIILFGAGKLPKVMGDLGKGIKNLRDELGGSGDAKDGKQEVLPPEDKK